MQIFIMRHAHTKSIEKFSNDKERSLSRQGYRELEYIHDNLPKDLVSVPLILCSTAVRTRETLIPLLPFLLNVQRILFLDTLYNASSETILEEINLYKDDFSSILLIAHNLGVSLFLQEVLCCCPVFETPPVPDVLPTAAISQFSAPQTTGPFMTKQLVFKKLYIPKIPV